MPAFEPIRVCTDDLPTANRQEAIRDFFGRMMQRMDYAPLGEQPMRIDASALLLPGVTIGMSSSSPLSIERTNDLLVDGRDDVLLSLMSAGCAVTSATGLHVEVAPGDVLLCSINHPMRIVLPGEDKGVVTLQMPRSSLTGLCEPVDDRPARAMPWALPVLRLLFGYMNAVMELPLTSPALRRKVALHLIDLAQLAIGPTRDEVENSQGSARAARLALAKQITSQRLTHPGFDASDMAARLGISTRYLRMLFEPEGMSFVDYLLERRLEKVLAALADPSRHNRRIIDIANECGFGDIRTFNRAVRKHYGMTPSELRELAQERRDRHEAADRAST